MTCFRHYKLCRDGECLLRHASSKEVQKATGFSGAHIWNCANFARKLGGIYDVFFDDDVDALEKDVACDEKAARRKFGDRNYEEWREMNERYGKKTKETSTRQKSFK